MVNIIGILLLLTFSIGVSGQNPYIERFVPPSPTASSLGQYGEVPVSLYTGVANVQVPLYTLQERGLSVPINLSYHASGIKVDQMPSWVGLGWALNAGGTITRTIMGLPDEDANGYTAHADRIIDYLNGVPDTNMSVKDEDVAWWTATGIWDSEPDIYYYNIGGMSGKMVFDKTGTPRMIPHANLSITGSVTTGFTVKSPDGTTYVFGASESTTTSTTGDDPNYTSGNTAFNLTSITGVNGSNINFTYERDILDYSIDRSQTKRHNMPGFTEAECAESGSIIHNDILYTVSAGRVSKIETDLIVVKFIENSISNSFGMKYLDRIEVYNKNNLSVPIREYDLTISNFGTGNERGKLESVVEKDGLGNTLSPYTFDYNDVSFPVRHSSKQDHWGYYNSNPSDDLIPETSQLTYTVAGSPHTIDYGGADRSPSAARSQALMLTKITYPTGGHTAFEYEQHTYSSVGSQRIYENLNYDITESKHIEIDAYASQTTNSFVIGSTQQLYVSVDVTGLPGITGEIAGWVELRRLNGSVVHSYTIPADNTTHRKTLSWTLLPGTYEFYGISDIGESIIAGFSYLTPVSITEPIEPSIGVENAGGVRIKKVTIHNGISVIDDQVKTYDYNTGDISNGVLLFRPLYEIFQTNVVRKVIGQGGLAIYKECPLFVRTSSNRSALGSTQGSHIGYSKVTEYFGEGSSVNGKTEYEFTSSLEYPDNPFGLVSLPVVLTSYDFKRGLLKKRVDYKSDNLGNYFPVKETVNNYIFRTDVNMTSVPAFKIAVRKGYLFNQDWNEYNLGLYNHISQWYYLGSKTEKIYDQEGSNSMSTSINYTYSPYHLQPILTNTINSKGQTEITEMKYASDLNDGLLISAFMHSIPLETARWVNGVIVSKATTMYTREGVNILPTKFKTFPTGGVNLIETDYKYDSKGNPLEVSQEGGSHISYLWGYGGTYPVAQVQNATYSEISSVINQSILDSPSSDAALRTELDKLRNPANLKGVLVTTMTYKPGVGMTSQTSPNGLTMYYEYDSFGRLQHIKDKDGNILKKNEYAYKVNANATNN
tara:strand:+ start:1336 stop:4494 length:3159 start_codon:yes stop_codon:yes gene_type:complete